MTALPFTTLSSYCSSSFFGLHTEQYRSPVTEQFHLPSFWNSQFSNFIFEKQIAVTQNSLVWLGTLKNSCEHVALKITDKFESESSEKIHQIKQNQFVNQHHLACMVQVKQVVTNGQFRLMVMKYYPWDLEHIMNVFTTNKNRKYTQEHILLIVYAFRSIINSLSELHSAGFVHRDLKPDNILVDEEYNIVLSDFGLVTKQLQIDLSCSGTLQYLAPERLSKKRRQNPIKKSVDIWSLGVILYEFFTGESPYDGDSQEQIFEKICQGYIRSKQIPSDVMSLINGILEVNSEKRLTLEQIKKHPFLQKEVDQNLLKKIIQKYL